MPRTQYWQIVAFETSGNGIADKPPGPHDDDSLRPHRGGIAVLKHR
jgi:hypothetical protein